ncbi:ornithine aminomutase subunit alpha [Jeotgalibaca caeni]|uniref:ornithine aminomutase subunit alpha n=1 Tax=Jeotgalibaca caeni TaxID=3028623 RepID=UPI00237DE355|nr:ornithine aminomutase subunit alpha [Jeotgalibaca caeni]MDE1547614.1 ornithine aminomutase subunit alpha [Jeotgalibaca caeni]
MEQSIETSFEEKRKHLIDLSDEQLKEHFWKLAEEIVQPLLDLGHEYTSPSIERSVLLRMGFSSIEATEIVNRVIQNELMGKGAGHIVYLVAKKNGLSVREAGLKLAEGSYWDQMGQLFNGGHE